MKHLSIFILLTLSAGFLFVQAPEAFIREMTGTVELKTNASADWVSAKARLRQYGRRLLTNASADWVSAKAGDRIGKNTIVSTSFKSTAILSAGNSTIVVRPLTRLSLAELMSQNETETVNVNLNTGRIRVDVNPPAGSKANFLVQTPMSTASIRGTAFDMNTGNIRVRKGSVNYGSANKTFNRSVRVNVGQKSWIDTRTGRTVHPNAAAEKDRSLPNLPGQDASNRGAQFAVPGGKGMITVEIIF
jgi:hypothetical protein